MLDEKDKKLVYELDLNSRLSIRQLSKKIELSQEATRYRLNKLKEKGIITNFVTYLNFTKLGYFGYSVYCRYNTTTEQKKDEIKSYLKKNKSIYWIAEFGGKIDLAFSILAKTPLEFDKILSQIINRYSKYLIDIKIIVKLEPHKYSRKYLSKSKKVSKEETIEFDNYRLSKTERKILGEITTNARINSATISDKIGVPLSTVIYCIKKMIKENIISGFTILLQPNTFGYQSFQVNIVTQNINEEKLKKLLVYCKNHPNIIFFIKVLGDWNIELIYEVENVKKMQENLIDLRNQFSDIIKDIELVNLFEDYIKLDHYPFKDQY